MPLPLNNVNPITGRVGIPNIDPETGTAYGVISYNSIKGEWLNDVYEKGTNVTEANALEEFKAELKAEGIDEDHDDYEDRLQAWSDSCEFDSPTYEYDDGNGLQVLTTSLGLYVIKSPVTAEVRGCSPCCPNAGDLDSPGGSVVAYDLPRGWRIDEPDNEVRVAIQCAAHGGKVGTFAYDGDIKGKFCQFSPVFDSLVGLYAWFRDNGWTSIGAGLADDRWEK